MFLNKSSAFFVNFALPRFIAKYPVRIHFDNCAFVCGYNFEASLTLTATILQSCCKAVECNPSKSLDSLSLHLLHYPLGNQYVHIC